MKIGLFVFSGTGNTLKVSEYISSLLSNKGHDVSIVRVRKKMDLCDTSLYDTLIFAYPVHAFNTPLPMLKFIKALDEGRKRKAYLVMTSGEALALNKAAARDARRALVKKGYSFSGAFHYVMPYNIIFRHSEKMASRMWRDAKIKAEKDVSSIHNEETSEFKISLIANIVSLVLKIEHPAMPLIGMGYRASKDCSACGLCVRLCPAENIEIRKGKARFKHSCTGCMSCAFNCPADAVRISILNSWRVNGKYSFSSDVAGDDEVCSYCHKSYIRYFHLIEDNLLT